MKSLLLSSALTLALLAGCGSSPNSEPEMDAGPPPGNDGSEPDASEEPLGCTAGSFDHDDDPETACVTMTTCPPR